MDASFLNNVKENGLHVVDKHQYLILDPNSTNFNPDILFMQPQRIKKYDVWKRSNVLPECKEYLVHVFVG